MSVVRLRCIEGSKLGGLVRRAQDLLHLPGPLSPKDKDPSALSLKALFQTHASLISANINRLKDSNHPVLAVATELLEETSRPPTPQLRPTLLLLVSKAVGLPQHHPPLKQILTKQQLLSEICELMAAAYSLHRSVVSLGSREADSRVDHGNKLATLMGDLLLARSTQKLSQLKHNPVTELMSNALADFAESEVLGLPLSATPLDPVRPTLDLWLRRTSLGLGSLMAHSCQSSAMLAGHDEQLRDFSFTLGLNLGITLQAYTEIEGGGASGHWALPLVRELELSPDSLKRGSDLVASGRAVAGARETLVEYEEKTSRAISQLPPSPATELLSNILAQLAS